MREINKILGEIKMILKDDFKNLQSWSDFKEWKIGEEKHFENGVKAAKIYETPTRYRFSTTIPPMTSFSTHWHDCDEVCTVVAGILGDKTNNRKYKMNEQCVISKGQAHTPYNPSKSHDCVLIVDFYR